MRKSVVLITLAISILYNISPASAEQIKFVDIKGYPSEEINQVHKLVDKGVINGTSASTFNPNGLFKSAHVVKILGRYLTTTDYFDAPIDYEQYQMDFGNYEISTDWPDRELIKYSLLLYRWDVFRHEDQALRPDETVSRQAIAMTLDRFTEVLTGMSLVEYAEQIHATSSVKDLKKADVIAQDSIKALNALNISTAENFNPNGSLKRIQFVKLFSNTLDHISEIKKMNDKIYEEVSTNVETPKVIERMIDSYEDFLKAEAVAKDGDVLTLNVSDIKKWSNNMYENMLPSGYIATEKSLTLNLIGEDKSVKHSSFFVLAPNTTINDYSNGSDITVRDASKVYKYGNSVMTMNDDTGGVFINKTNIKLTVFQMGGTFTYEGNSIYNLKVFGGTVNLNTDAVFFTLPTRINESFKLNARKNTKIEYLIARNHLKTGDTSGMSLEDLRVIEKNTFDRLRVEINLLVKDDLTNPVKYYHLKNLVDSAKLHIYYEKERWANNLNRDTALLNSTLEYIKDVPYHMNLNEEYSLLSDNPYDYTYKKHYEGVESFSKAVLEVYNVFGERLTNVDGEFIMYGTKDAKGFSINPKGIFRFDKRVSKGQYFIYFKTNDYPLNSNEFLVLVTSLNPSSD